MISMVGSKDQAWSIAQQMFVESAAYREHLQTLHPRLKEREADAIKDLRSVLDWQEMPVVTKSSFYAKHSLKALIPESNRNKIYSYTRSSGTSSSSNSKSLSSKGFFWPEMKAPAEELADDFSVLLRQMVAEDEGPTLLIVGLSLGSWAGGEQMSFSSRISALNLGQSLVVYSPGNNHSEIIEAIHLHEADFKKIIVACCPSAIYYLLKLADDLNMDFPLDKTTFLVTGEPFAEETRIELQKRAGVKNRGPVMCSLYSSADTGVLGVESAHLIRLRQLILQNPAMSEKLQLERGSVPNFFHLNTKNRFYESIDNNLVMTFWQGLPLVRYNLEDRVQLFSWKEISEAAIAIAPTERDRKLWKLLGSYELPDVVAVYGRNNGCLFLCGSNVFDSMLAEILVGSPILKGKVTGHFMVWIGVTEKGQQQLHWLIECKGKDNVLSDDISEALCLEFADSLGRLQPEFKDDYEKFYSQASGPKDRIFQFHFCKEGVVENHKNYFTGVQKRKIIQPKNPLE